MSREWSTVYLVCVSVWQRGRKAEGGEILSEGESESGEDTGRRRRRHSGSDADSPPAAAGDKDTKRKKQRWDMMLRRGVLMGLSVNIGLEFVSLCMHDTSNCLNLVFSFEHVEKQRQCETFMFKSPVYPCVCVLIYCGISSSEMDVLAISSSLSEVYCRDLRIVFFCSNRISNRIGRPIRFRIESSNRIGHIPRKP